MKDRRHIAAWALGAAAFALGSVVVAQQTTDGPYVLHEFVSERVLSGSAAGARPFGGGDEESEDGQAAPERVPGQPPPLTTEATDDEPVWGADGPIARDEVEAPHGPMNPFGGPNVLDDRTDRVNSLTYFANFDPSVIPLKRVVSQNEVIQVAGGEYAVRVDPNPRQAVEVGGDAAPGDETFWGSFLLRTEPEQLHPIASVSPGQRVLEIQTEPQVPVDLVRDRAGNFLLRTKHRGLLRLNMKIAVDPFYFSGEFDDTVQWGDFESFEDSPMIDRQIRLRALAVLRTLGVSKSISPREAVRKLVAHYRDFEAKPFPDELKGGDLFESITTNSIGVCRHRSLSFVIAAQSLGIPAHYVNNEAHAFVEIGWPGRGWRRIDLGGAADELNAAADGGRSLHQPESDSLPRPDRYLEEQRLMAQNGLNGDQGESQGDDSESDGSESGDRGDRGDASAGAGDATGEESTGEVDGAPTEVSAAPGEPTGDGTPVGEMTAEMQRELLEALGNADGAEPPKLAPTSLDLVEAASSVRRGGEIQVVGRLRGENGPVEGARVVAYLGPPGTQSVAGAVRLGEAVTDARGVAAIRAVVPKEQSTGRWSLFLVYPGSADFAPAVAE